MKVSIEYGLCEVLNNVAIRPNVAPKDGNISFDISVLEAMFPAGTVDNNVARVYNEVQRISSKFYYIEILSKNENLLFHKLQLPQWGESFSEAGARYQQTIMKLADKYPTENLLFLTHGKKINFC